MKMFHKSLFAIPLMTVSASFGASLVDGPGYTIEPFKAEHEYGPVKPLAPIGMSLKDGVMLKNGKPHFWFGNGSGPGAGQQGPFGLWLTWLQGTDVLTFFHGAHTQVDETKDGKAVVRSSASPNLVSWGREAMRIGLMPEFFHNWNMNGSAAKPLLKTLESHPDLAEIIHDYGHYLGCDAGYPDGKEILVNRYTAVADALKSNRNAFFQELCREPAPHPHNRRAYESFRAYVREKYGTLEEACKTWRINYASWDEVIPPHLDRQRWKFNGSIEDYLRRQMLKRDFPEIYWDWIDWTQRDLTKSIHDVIAALHKRCPGVPFTIDVRGHTDRHDGYAAIVPEWIDPSEDLFAIHNTTHAFAYGGRPYDRVSVIDSATYPFFGMGYFRRNVKGALVNSEDIISVARTPNANHGMMAKNCLAQLVNTPWKFKTDPSGKGDKGAYVKPDFDDSSWDDIAVPGTWDTDRRYLGYSGVAWYRKTFVAPSCYKADHEDGSRIFKLIGTGVAQEGEVWLNGQKLGQLTGNAWNKPYSFDVGHLLSYGGKNVLVWRVDGRGKGQNGLRFESYILADDMLSKPEPFNERQFRHLVFSQIMEGLSGVWIWHWHDDGLRAYQPQLYAQAQTTAQIALPALRHRRGEVALLYPYSDQPGLPAAHDSTHEGYLDFACAAAFLGQKADIVGEDAFCREVTPDRYPVLLVPLSKRVTSKTYAHFKDYVEKGGVAVLTETSLTRTAERYAKTDVAEFAGRNGALSPNGVETKRGKGRVITIPGRLTMDELFQILSRILPKPSIVISSANNGERPLIDRQIAGDGDNKVLLLVNWGGQEHPLSISLPESVKGWKVSNVVGDFVTAADGTVNVRVPSCDAAVAMLTRHGAKEAQFCRVSPIRQRKMRELEAMLSRFVPVEKSDVLFMRNSYGRGGFVMGAELMPEYIRAAEKLGLTCAQSDPKSWTPETLKGRKLVILSESNSRTFFAKNAKKEFWDMIENYVRDGGSVLVVSAQSDTTNINGLALRATDRFGGSVVWKTPTVKMPGDGVWGDPLQFHGEAVAGNPLCEEVGKVLVSATRGMTEYRPKAKERKSGKALPKASSVIKVPADAIDGAGGNVVMASELAAGRVVLCTDATMFQPFRIEHDDNANLLLNAMGWLARKQIDAEMRRDFRAKLYLTERDLAMISAEE